MHIYELAWIALLAAGYGSSQALLAFAWCSQLQQRLWRKRDSTHCVLSYGLTQIGKYLPGNFAHFAARHFSGTQRGERHRSLIYANSCEVLLLLFYALLAWLVLRSWSKSSGLTLALSDWMIFVTVAVTGFVAQSLLDHFALRNHWISGSAHHRLLVLTRNLAYLLFILGSLASFCLLAWILIPDLEPEVFPLLAASYIAAWVLGYITPGVPGGLGIREALLVGSTSIWLGDFDALRLALLSRLLTVAGDIFLFTTSLVAANYLHRRSALLTK